MSLRLPGLPWVMRVTVVLPSSKPIGRRGILPGTKTKLFVRPTIDPDRPLLQKARIPFRTRQTVALKLLRKRGLVPVEGGTIITPTETFPVLVAPLETLIQPGSPRTALIALVGSMATTLRLKPTVIFWAHCYFKGRL